MAEIHLEQAVKHPITVETHLPFTLQAIGKLRLAFGEDWCRVEGIAKVAGLVDVWDPSAGDSEYLSLESCSWQAAQHEPALIAQERCHSIHRKTVKVCMHGYA